MSPITTIFAVTLTICLTSSYGHTSTTSPTNHPASLDHHTPRPIDDHRRPTHPEADEKQMTHDDDTIPEMFETTNQRTDDRNRNPSDASETTPAKQMTHVRNVRNKRHGHYKVGKSKLVVDMLDSKEFGVLPSEKCPADKVYNPATGQCEDKSDEPTELDLEYEL